MVKLSAHKIQLKFKVEKIVSQNKIKSHSQKKQSCWEFQALNSFHSLPNSFYLSFPSKNVYCILRGEISQSCLKRNFVDILNSICRWRPFLPSLSLKKNYPFLDHKHCMIFGMPDSNMSQEKTHIFCIDIRINNIDC